MDVYFPKTLSNIVTPVSSLVSDTAHLTPALHHGSLKSHSVIISLNGSLVWKNLPSSIFPKRNDLHYDMSVLFLW